MVQAYVRNPDCFPVKILVPAGVYVRLSQSGAVHILKASIRPDGHTVVTLCKRRAPGPARRPIDVRAYLPSTYRACKACLRKLRRNLDQFEGGHAR